MDQLSFIAEIITALIWPITLLIVIFLLRNEIKALIPALTRVTYGDLELTFDQELAEMASAAEAADLPPADEPIITRSPSAVPPEPQELARTYPKGVIIDAWQAVEDAINDLMQRTDKPQPKTPVSKAKALKEEGMLDDHTLKLLSSMRGLRNMTVHEKNFQPSPKQAAEYSQIAERLVKRIEKDTA